MVLSRRTSWSRQASPWFEAIAHARERGQRLVDLTESNPTRCGLGDSRDEIALLGDERGVHYVPEACGLYEAREAIARYYAERGRAVTPGDVVLSASTSEAYAWLFKLLCDPGERVLAPRPSYPLFPYIADLELVTLVPYPLLRVERWRIDAGALERTLDAHDDIRAILLVHPGNPTGALTHPDDRALLVEIAKERDLALVVDEVFLDYAPRAESFAGEPDALTFVLSGMSKVALLPQVKLAWTVVSGRGAAEARARLEIIADTFLSVSTAVQLACGPLLEASAAARHSLDVRIRHNSAIVDAVIGRAPSLRRIPSDGGWYACIEVPRTYGDDAWCRRLVEREGIIVHPGHFFDMEEDGVMVVSLLPEDFEPAFTRAAALWAEG